MPRKTAGLLADLGFRYDSSLLHAADQPRGAMRTLGGGLVNVPWTFIAHPRASGLADERFAAFERVVRRVVDDSRIRTGRVRDIVPEDRDAVR